MTRARDHFFTIACTVELSLLPIALAIALPAGRSLFADLALNSRALTAGVAATLPLLAGFWWVMHSRINAITRIRKILENDVRRLMAPLSVGQIAVVSALAGFCEEVLFRGAVQGALTDALGVVPAVLIASAIFGLLHLITPAYAILATLIGVYLGVLWLATGNLLVTIVAHALYDFVALIYLLRFRAALPEPPVPEAQSIADDKDI